MNGSLISLFIFIFGFSAQAQARVRDLSFLFVGAGGVMASTYGGGRGSELEAWTDKQSKTTVQFGSACGVDYEMRLYGSNAYNFLVYGLKNHTNNEFRVERHRARMVFDTGIERLAFNSHFAYLEKLDSEAEMLSGFPFSSKDDFRGAKQITVTIPLKSTARNTDCLMTATFIKDPNYQENSGSEMDQESVTTFEFLFGYGPILSRSKELEKISSDGSANSIGVYGYFGMNHGFFLDLTWDYLKNADAARLSPIRGGAAGDPSAQIFNIDLGYSYRHSPSRDFYFNYDIGLSAPTFMYKNVNGDQELDEQSIAIAPMHRLSLNYRLKRITSGRWAADYLLGIAVFQNYYLDNNVKTVSFVGTSTGAQLFLKIGG